MILQAPRWHRSTKRQQEIKIIKKKNSQQQSTNTNQTLANKTKI